MIVISRKNKTIIILSVAILLSVLFAFKYLSINIGDKVEADVFINQVGYIRDIEIENEIKEIAQFQDEDAFQLNKDNENLKGLKMVNDIVNPFLDMKVNKKTTESKLKNASWKKKHSNEYTFIYNIRSLVVIDNKYIDGNVEKIIEEIQVELLDNVGDDFIEARVYKDIKNNEIIVRAVGLDVWHTGKAIEKEKN